MDPFIFLKMMVFMIAKFDKVVGLTFHRKLQSPIFTDLFIFYFFLLYFEKKLHSIYIICRINNHQLGGGGKNN